ncbi:hypothetical protein HMPREF1155_1823 [Slackia sp. CM382]|nr:hypothetical protein HMPREF1155_1823 [Slackia sp. CM382]
MKASYHDARVGVRCADRASGFRWDVSIRENTKKVHFGRREGPLWACFFPHDAATFEGMRSGGGNPGRLSAASRIATTDRFSSKGRDKAWQSTAGVRS